MEKALKILNRLKEQIVDSYTPPYNVEISYTEDFESDIVQAIGELEEAMQPKTCDGCIADCSVKDALNLHGQFWDYQCDVGCKSRHEPKDNA